MYILSWTDAYFKSDYEDNIQTDRFLQRLITLKMINLAANMRIHFITCLQFLRSKNKLKNPLFDLFLFMLI